MRRYSRKLNANKHLLFGINTSMRGQRDTHMSFYTSAYEFFFAKKLKIRKNNKFFM